MLIADTNPNIDVQESEYLRLLGYPPDREPSERSRELMMWAREWYRENGRPWIYARSAGGIGLMKGEMGVEIEGERFASRRLHHQLIHVEGHKVILAAVSAGKEPEEHARKLWEEGRPDEYFFLEVYGSAVVEHLITVTGFRLCEWADHQGMAVLPHDSPGYPGWEISDQRRLLDLLRRQNSVPGELQALESGMLRPKKSLLGVFGITRNATQVQHLTSLVPCQSCSYQACQYRRAPTRKSLPRLEQLGSPRRPIMIQKNRKEQ